MFKKRYLILELANSHNGVKSNIYNLLNKINFNEVKNVGLKYQIISKKYLSVKSYKWHKVYQKLFFNKKIWRKIIFDTSKLNLDIWLDIFDIYGVQILKENFGRIYGIKLQSSVLNNYELISELEKLKLNNKKILINIAGHDYSEIKFLIKKMTAKFKTKPIIQVGFQNYPTEKKYIHLNKIKMIRPILDNCETSFADHISFSDKDFSRKFYPNFSFLIRKKRSGVRGRINSRRIRARFFLFNGRFFLSNQEKRSRTGPSN